MHHSAEERHAQLHLAILGLEPGVSFEVVRQTYRELAIKWHPDKFHDDPAAAAIATEQLKQIIAAFQWLRDNRSVWEQHKPPHVVASTRAEEQSPPKGATSYDAPGAPPPASSGPSGESKHWPANPGIGKTQRRFAIVIAIITLGFLLLPWLDSQF